MPNTVLGTEDTAVSKTVSSLLEHSSWPAPSMLFSKCLYSAFFAHESYLFHSSLFLLDVFNLIKINYIFSLHLFILVQNP